MFVVIFRILTLAIFDCAVTTSVAHSSVPLPFNLSLRQAKDRAWVRGQNQAGYPFQIINHSHHVILFYPYYESRCPKTYIDPVLGLDTSNLLKRLRWLPMVLFSYNRIYRDQTLSARITRGMFVASYNKIFHI